MTIQIDPTFQLNTYWLTSTYCEAVYRPVEEALGYSLSENLVPFTLLDTTVVMVDETTWHKLHDVEPLVSRVSQLLDTRGGASAFIPMRGEICYTRNASYLAIEFSRPSYRMPFQVTPQVVMQAQRHKRVHDRAIR